jgi:hypothetical protein
MLYIMEPYTYDEIYKQKYFALVNKEEDCWRWKIYSPGAECQGRFYHRGRYRRNRAVAYELYNNLSSGDNKVMLYCICKNKGCINPEHVCLRSHSKRC